MSHEPHDHVHRLIRSMTRTEKRYFKLYAKRHAVGSRSSHCELFDAIADMEVYKESALHRVFEGAAFLRRFTVTKHRLYDSILASLEAFHADSSIDARLRRTLHQTELLYQRGLYHDAERMLRGVRMLAEQHGKLSILMDVVEWERRLMERTHYEGVQEADLLKIASEIGDLRTEWDENERLWQLKSRSFMLLYRQGKARDQRSARDLRTLLEDPVLQDEAHPRSAKARFLQHHIRSAIAFSLNDLEECERHLSLNDGLLVRESAHFRDEPNLQLSVMSNLAYVRMRLGRYPEALDGLKRFKQLPLMLPSAPSPDLEMKVFAMGASLELTVLCRMGEFSKAVEKLGFVEEGCARFDDSLSVIRRSGIRFQAAWACFGAGHHDMAAHWCQLLLNERGIETHEEVHAMGRLLHLLIMLESGKLDLLNYGVRNVERFLRSHDREHGVEQAMLKYVRARIREGMRAEPGKACDDLVAALTVLERTPLEHAVFDHFDPLCYALSKATGRSMAEVARERAAPTAPAVPIQPVRKRKAA